jgi:hypothetical protein
MASVSPSRASGVWKTTAGTTPPRLPNDGDDDGGGSVVASDAIRQRDEGEGHRFRAGGTDTRSR